MNLESPWFLLLIPLSYLLFRIFKTRGHLGYPSLSRLPEPAPLKVRIIRLPRLFWFLALAFAILGLCHPQSHLQETDVTTQGRELILCIDTSFSMSGHALEVVKEVITDFVKRRSNDLIGITIFGTDAALVVLPTQEYSLLENSLKRIQASQVGFQTAIGEGLFTSMMALIEEEMGRDVEIRKVRESINKEHLGDYALMLTRKVGTKKNRVIILFTDGIYNVGIDPTRPLKLASRLGIRVYVVAVEPSAETGVEPEQAISRIAALKGGVVATGGRYFKSEGIPEVEKESGVADARAIWGALSPASWHSEIERLYKEVDAIERDRVFLERTAKKKDLYFYPALLGLVFLLGMVTIENIWISVP